MIQQQAGGGTSYIWRPRRETQWDRTTGIYRIIWEINRSVWETGMETQQETLLRGSEQGESDCHGGKPTAGIIRDPKYRMGWDPDTRLRAQDGLISVTANIMRSLPFFTWIAEPWP